MPNAPPQPRPASSSAKTHRRHSEEPRDEHACPRQGICFCFVVRTVAKPNVTLTQRRDIVRFGGRANVWLASRQVLAEKSQVSASHNVQALAEYILKLALRDKLRHGRNVRRESTVFVNNARN